MPAPAHRAHHAHQTMPSTVRDQLRTFIVTRLALGLDPEHLDDASSLMEMGVLDSVGVLDLVGYLEQTWSITIEDEELMPANLDSVDAIVAFVARKVE